MVIVSIFLPIHKQSAKILVVYQHFPKIVRLSAENILVGIAEQQPFRAVAIILGNPYEGTHLRKMRITHNPMDTDVIRKRQHPDFLLGLIVALMQDDDKLLEPLNVVEREPFLHGMGFIADHTGEG